MIMNEFPSFCHPQHHLIIECNLNLCCAFKRIWFENICFAHKKTQSGRSLACTTHTHLMHRMKFHQIDKSNSNNIAFSRIRSDCSIWFLSFFDGKHWNFYGKSTEQSTWDTAPCSLFFMWSLVKLFRPLSHTLKHSLFITRLFVCLFMCLLSFYSVFVALPFCFINGMITDFGMHKHFTHTGTRYQRLDLFFFSLHEWRENQKFQWISHTQLVENTL